MLDKFVNCVDYFFFLSASRLPHQDTSSPGGEGDRFVLLNSLLDLRRECSVRALGGLLGFLDKNPLGGPDLDAQGGGGCIVLSIGTITLVKILVCFGLR